jgi:lipopolysaccharide/colanic/teichoic acid biosynthesis glycosyltransferase
MSTATPEIGDVATTALIHDKRSSTGYEAIKPMLDFSLALFMLVLATPIILVTLLAVRLTSRGRALYMQRRLGRNGKEFTIYKIRTMYVNCERESGPRWSVAGDPRVTPIGWFLRRTHIDELPQLINVLMGHMSLVGPRPERPEFLGQLERALPNYRDRLIVRPGLTGLAQVQQPPDEDLFSVRRKLSYDLCYVEKINLWLDVRLILATAFKLLGVAFPVIGRICRLPVPDGETLCELRDANAHVAAKAIVPESCAG